MNLSELARIRRSKRISQQAMAEAIGLRDKSSWSYIESGKTKLATDHLPAIASKLGMSLFDLVHILFFRHM